MNRTKYFLLLITFLVSMISANAAGDVDTSFNSYAAVDNSVNVNVVKTQPDGKILIGGFFTVVDGKPKYGLSRLNLDGSQDTSFNPPEFTGVYGIGGIIQAIAFQSDGKIIVGGLIIGIGTENRPGLRRLNIDGSVDNTFNVLELRQDHSIVDIDVLPNDKLIISGNIISASGNYNGFLQLNSNGTLDSSFTPDQFVGSASGVELQPDGKVIVASTNPNGPPNQQAPGLRRYSSTGVVDTSFTPVEAFGITDLKLFENGSILICGTFGGVNGFTQTGLSKINSDGSIDLSFNLGNAGVAGAFYDIIERPNGKLVLSGIFTSFNGIARRNIVQLNADGSVDSSFQFSNNFNGQNDNFRETQLLSNGQIVVATISPQNAPILFKLNTDGTQDMSFTPKITRIGNVRRILQQADGKIVYGGRFDIANNTPRNSLTRVNADGSNDSSFVPYFNSTAKQTVTAIAPQPDGKLLVGTIGGGIQLKRLNIDGSEDTSFNPSLTSNTSVEDIFVLPGGKVLVSTNLSGNVWQIRRFNADGSTDSTFVAPSPTGSIYKILAQADGKILIAGNFQQLGAAIRGRIARLNTDGSLDTSFNPPGGANDTVNDIDLQNDGKIVLVGNFSGLNGNLTKKRIGRLNGDGSLDTSFTQSSDAAVYGVKIQSNGKILVCGAMSLVGSTAKKGIARLNTDGTLDPSLVSDADQTVFDVNLQTDNNILVAGDFLKINTVSAIRVARLNSGSTIANQTKQFDFDGDGKADIALYRPSTNFWYRLDSSNGQFSERNFGIAVDLLSPADYDNDGKTDLSIFRPTTGTWWYRDLTSGNFFATQWGASGDLPVPSDFDGDGKADRIVFRPSNGGWYRLKSSNGQFDSTQFGQLGDVPLIADFDGDGKSDIAVFRPSSGTWYWLESSTGQFRGFQFGQNGDLAVPADYDGDGKTEFAVFRQSSGDWFFINSSTGLFRHFNFGVSGDKPVAADYDGDGKADIAVFRPSVGTWYLQRSQLGFTSVQFGSAGDIPIPAAFVR